MSNIFKIFSCLAVITGINIIEPETQRVRDYAQSWGSKLNKIIFLTLREIAFVDD